MFDLLNRFKGEESGATAIEYGLIAALVAVAIIGALQGMRNSLSDTFNKVSSSVNTATSSAP